MGLGGVGGGGRSLKRVRHGGGNHIQQQSLHLATPPGPMLNSLIPQPGHTHHSHHSSPSPAGRPPAPPPPVAFALIWSFPKFLPSKLHMPLPWHITEAAQAAPRMLHIHFHYFESVSRSAVSDSLPPHGLQPSRLLCPQNSPGKNTGVGSNSLLQGTFLTQGWNRGLLHCRWILYWLSHQGTLLSLCSVQFSCSVVSNSSQPHRLTSASLQAFLPR